MTSGCAFRAAESRKGAGSSRRSCNFGACTATQQLCLCRAPLPRVTRPGRGPRVARVGDRSRVRTTGKGAREMTKLRLSYVTGRTYTHGGLEENARSSSAQQATAAGLRARKGAGGWRRSHGNCAGWLTRERAARGGPLQPASCSRMQLGVSVAQLAQVLFNPTESLPPSSPTSSRG